MEIVVECAMKTVISDIVRKGMDNTKLEKGNFEEINADYAYAKVYTCIVLFHKLTMNRRIWTALVLILGEPRILRRLWDETFA